jgi:hypothetical protein
VARHGKGKCRVEREVAAWRGIAPFAKTGVFDWWENAQVWLSKSGFDSFWPAPLFVLRDGSIKLQNVLAPSPHTGTTVMLQVDTRYSGSSFTQAHRYVLALILLAHVDASLTGSPHVTSEVSTLARRACGRDVCFSIYTSDFGFSWLFDRWAGGLATRALGRRGG